MSAKARCIRIIAISLLVTLAACAQAAHPVALVKELAKGVTLFQKLIPTGAPTASPQIVNVLKIDPSIPGVRIQAVLARDRVLDADKTKGREAVSSIAKRLNATVAVNADFFPFTGDVLNLHISDGELVSEPNPKRPVFGITSDGRFLIDRVDLDARITLESGRWFPIRGINRPRQQHQLVAYTSRFSESTGTTNGGSEAIIKCEGLPVKVGTKISGSVLEVRQNAGDTPIHEGTIVLSGSGTGQRFIDEHLSPGMTVEIEFSLKSSKNLEWERVTEAVGGGPYLVSNGRVCMDPTAEGFQASFYAIPHPRTALSITRDGKLLLVTVDGRQSMSKGMTLSQLADFMIAEGCEEAVNLDGGGSTTMATPLGVLNSPSEGTERPVANALVISAQPLDEEAPDFSIRLESNIAESGKPMKLILLDASGQPLSSDLVEKAVWTTTGGVGFVDQSGNLYGLRSRRGTVSARIGSRWATLPVEPSSITPPVVSARLEADPTGAKNRSILQISVKDSNGNVVPEARISVQVTGGSSDEAELLTDSNGFATTGVNWNPASPEHQVSVTCGDSAPVLLSWP